MIILTKSIIEKETDLKSIIEKEKTAINLMLDSQNVKKDILLDTKQRFTNYTNTADPNFTDSINFFLNNFENTLALSKTNIYLLNNLLDLLNNIENIKNKEFNNDAIEKFNKTFFETNEVVSSNSIQIEKTLNHILAFSYATDNVLDKFMQNLNIKEAQNTIFPKNNIKLDNKTSESNYKIKNSIQNLSSNINIDTPTIETKENTLLISEKQNTVILPFTIYEVNSILKESNNKYANIDEVIKDIYTLPLENFKHPARARFREAFKLMRERENSSFKESFDLGLEVFFNYDLHPAIIAACKTLDELDIYLDCLEDNEINKFDCFNIVFDMSPALSNKIKLFNLKNKSLSSEF